MIDERGALAQFMNELLTPRTLCSKIRMSAKTLNDLNRQGRGPPQVRIGSRVYYRPGPVLAWLLLNETPAIGEKS